MCVDVCVFPYKIEILYVYEFLIWFFSPSPYLNTQNSDVIDFILLCKSLNVDAWVSYMVYEKMLGSVIYSGSPLYTQFTGSSFKTMVIFLY